jgi:hypothetical protein
MQGPAAGRPFFMDAPALANGPDQPQFGSMNTTASQNLVMLARMLERLDRSEVAVDAQQYRGVVERLTETLRTAPFDETLEAVLDASPATAQLYENLQYQHAGLCRSPLEAALNAELDARAVIDAARKSAAQPKT